MPRKVCASIIGLVLQLYGHRVDRVCSFISDGIMLWLLFWSKASALLSTLLCSAIVAGVIYSLSNVVSRLLWAADDDGSR